VEQVYESATAICEYSWEIQMLEFGENYTVSTSSNIIIMVNLNAKTPHSLNTQLTNQNPFWYV
jgi:hypothetical protein